MRIGDVARATGTTTRTIRYYEEIGLLTGSAVRRAGEHRLYSEVDVDRVREIVRLKELLGVTLDELKQLVEAEDARAVLREEWERGVEDPERRRRILEEAAGHVDRQLELVRRRQAELARLEEDLSARRARNRRRLRELGDE
jgi:DNA-binding transcriptional MerR regulator